MKMWVSGAKSSTFNLFAGYLRRYPSLSNIASNGKMNDELKRIWKEAVVA
jgi:hypothetical protein